MTGKVQQRQAEQASNRLRGAKMMRPKDAGCVTKPHRQGGVVNLGKVQQRQAQQASTRRRGGKGDATLGWRVFIGACVLLANLSTPCAVAVIFACMLACCPVTGHPCRPSFPGETPFRNLTKKQLRFVCFCFVCFFKRFVGALLPSQNFSEPLLVCCLRASAVLAPRPSFLACK